MVTNWAVGPGDSLSSIADETGHFWEFLWAHPKNEDLKNLRDNPETLVPGDSVFIPDLREKAMPCKIEQKNRFRRRGVSIKVAFTVALQDGEPFVGKSYSLIVGKAKFSGETDANGYLEH